MSSFIDWVRSSFIPERIKGDYNLLRADFTYVKPKKFKGTLPNRTIICYVDIKYQKNDIKVPNQLTLSEIKSTVEEIMVAGIDGKSPLKMILYTETDVWEFFWRNDLLLWIAYSHRYNKKLFNWMTNYPKAILNFEASQAQCQLTVNKFLIEYLSILRNDPDSMLTETYQSFVNENIKPTYDFIYSELNSLKDPRYIPKCRYYIEGHYSDDNSLTKLYLEGPPRDFMRDRVHVRPQRSKEVSYNKGISEGYIYDEDVLLIPNEQTLDWPLEGTLVRVPNLTESYRKLDAINILSNPVMIHHQRLLDLLSRPLALPEIEPIDVVNIKPVFQRDNEESEPQCRAIDKVFGSQDVTLIQGPPGTGKTEVICEMILQVVRKGGRVLLSSPTNVAVDNVIERIFNEKEVRPIRIGRPERIYKPEIKKLLLSYQVMNWKEITNINQKKVDSSKNKLSVTRLQQLQQTFFDRLDKENFREIRSMILDQANLVCGTCMGVVNMEFSEVSLEQPFDLMIVDEASKATLLEFLVPAVRARKWVLVGDHRQLAPYVSDIELKLYLQNFLEESELITKVQISDKKKSTNNITEGLREYSNYLSFHPEVEEIMKYVRRYHEEFHNLEQNYSEKYLHNILKVFEYRKEESKSFIEMVESSLGSCFHYFWRRVDETRKAYLPYQHRMPEEIAKLLNESIYNNKFFSSKDAKLHGFCIPLNSEHFTESPKSPTIFIDTGLNKNRNEKLKKKKKGKAARGSYINEIETEIIIYFVKNICAKFPMKTLNPKMSKEIFEENNPFRIGIITFYAYQAEEIKSNLSDLEFLRKTENKWLFKHKSKPIEVRVSIVDRFQGQEQEIILLSMVRSNIKNQTGFLKNIQRLNVALSRARHNMFVIGDHRFFLDSVKTWNRPEKARRRSKLEDSGSNPNIFLSILSKYYLKNKWISKYKPRSFGKQSQEVKLDKNKAYVTLLQIIKEHKQNTKKDCNTSNIGNRLFSIEPKWKEKFGFKSVSKLIEAAQEKKLVLIIEDSNSNKIVKLTKEGESYLFQKSLSKSNGRKNQ